MQSSLIGTRRIVQGLGGDAAKDGTASGSNRQSNERLTNKEMGIVATEATDHVPRVPCAKEIMFDGGRVD